MRVSVRAFARYREIIGDEEPVIDMPEGSTAKDLIDRLTEEYPGLGQYRDVILIAINREYIARSDLLRDGDVCVIFPPVSGG